MVVCSQGVYLRADSHETPNSGVSRGAGCFLEASSSLQHLVASWKLGTGARRAVSMDPCLSAVFCFTLSCGLLI